MDDNREQAKKKTDDCQMALTDELDSYTLYRFRPSAARLSGRFLATNRKAFHRKQMRLIVNEYFNKEEDDDEPTKPLLSQQATFPGQNRPRTLAEYRELFQKKSDDFKAALIYELNMYFQSRFRSSATGRGAQFFANQQSFHREQMLLLIDEFFNSEEDALPTFPSSTTVHSVNHLEVNSNEEAASDQVDTTPAIQSISPVTPSDQQQLINSGETQVKEKPIEEESSTQPRVVDAPNPIENIVIVSITEQVQSDCEADSDCGCDDCMADKGRVQADSVMIFLDCDNSEPLPNDATEELPTAGHVFEMANNQNIDETNNSLFNQEKDQVDEGVAQMQTDAQQQATVQTAGNSNAEQVDNSVNSNFGSLMDVAMDLSDDVAVNEQVDAEPIIDEPFIDETFPTDDLVSRPSTLTGRRLTRPRKMVNYAVPEEDSDDEYSTVNRNRKRTILRAGELTTHKRVAVEPVVVATENEEEEEEDENEDEEVGVEGESVRLSIIVHHLNCPEAGCTEECPDKAQLDEHLLSKHQIMAFRCKVKDCGLSFATQNELSDHRKLVHRNLKDLPCAQCETISKGFRKLYDHFRRCHEEGEFQCSADKCDFTGKTRSEVFNHQYTHRLRKYECTYADCTASFKQQSHLTAHQRVHTQERPFACEECHKAFTNKGDLTIHQRIHSGLKPYRCKWSGCDYSSKQRGHVYVHVRTLHFGLPASKKAQDELNIIDTRDAGEFIEKNPTK